MRALFVSPHLDDAAFSCGAIAAALVERGWQTTLLTVFTQSVLQPRGFALACQLDKGLGAEVDYMALRRAEDTRAAAVLGFERVVWLDLLEAPHRGYASAPALFDRFAADDDVASELTQRLAGHVAPYDAIFAPQGLGAHVDHRRVRDAILAIADPSRALWYRDTPYAIREPYARPALPAIGSLSAFAYPLAARDMAAKLDACAAYTSQLGFQFGSVAQMRATLWEFATAEGGRSDIAGPAEVVRAGPAARTALAEG